MNLHEYQAKQLLSAAHIPVSKGQVVDRPEDIPHALRQLGGQSWVVKAQVHAGGRGKAGGVKLVHSETEAKEAVTGLLGRHLVTYQTTPSGLPVHHVLIEEPCAVKKELYLGATIDRSKRRIVFMASTEGGVEIEEVAKKTPERILTLVSDPFFNIMPYQGRQCAFALGLAGDQIKQFVNILIGLGRLFKVYDLSLLEINPLVITQSGALLCLDAKINIDDNALYRQPELVKMRDVSQEEARENRAREFDLNYIALEGNIGCMVNGAGLAMATMDIIKLHGGQPANFLDVGGGATKERVAEAFKIILSDTHIKAILINIFGGIVRCDIIAEGIMAAIKEVNTTLPIVVRLAGNNAAKGEKMLKESGLNIIAVNGFTEAAKKVVEVAQG
jgi:succinyl-CoA synthetase beta subunit